MLINQLTGFYSIVEIYRTFLYFWAKNQVRFILLFKKQGGNRLVNFMLRLGVDNYFAVGFETLIQNGGWWIFYLLYENFIGTHIN